MIQCGPRSPIEFRERANQLSRRHFLGICLQEYVSNIRQEAYSEAFLRAAIACIKLRECGAGPRWPIATSQVRDSQQWFSAILLAVR
jgi:hypothetical protein